MKAVFSIVVISNRLSPVSSAGFVGDNWGGNTQYSLSQINYLTIFKPKTPNIFKLCGEDPLALLLDLSVSIFR